MREHTPDPGGEVLPCGTERSTLLDQIADGAPPSEHSARCPYCQDALRALTTRWAAVRAAAATPVPTPASLVPRTLARLRAERQVGLGRLEVPGDRGILSVGPRAVVTLARAAARNVAGVRVAAGNYDEGRLSLQVAVRHGLSLPDVAATVRDRIARDLGLGLGVPAPMIDVQVVDVWY